MDTLFSIISAIFAISIIVIVHEWGHYWVARRCGVIVEQFSIGFGRAIYQRHTQSGMLFRIGWLPLGGYVKLFGDELTDNPNMKKGSYRQISVYKRMAIVLAGPAINFILAIIIYTGLYTVGIPSTNTIIKAVQANSIAAKAGLKNGDQFKTIGGYKAIDLGRASILLIMHYNDKKNLKITIARPLNNAPYNLLLPLQHWTLNFDHPKLWQSLGITLLKPTPTTTIATVTPHSPAAQAAIKAGDTITAINTIPTKSFYDIHRLIQEAGKQPIHIHIQRQGQQHTVTLTPIIHSIKKKKVALIGVQPQWHWPHNLKTTIQFPFFQAIAHAAEETLLLIHVNVVILIKLCLGLFPVNALGGPVAIFSAASHSAALGMIPYLIFIAYISIAIGFLNVLPIPGLDGGHFFQQIIEVIRKKPLTARMQTLLLKIGFSALFVLIVIVTLNDVSKLL